MINAVKGYITEAEARKILLDAGIQDLQRKAGFMPSKDLSEDFTSYYGFGDTLRFEGRFTKSEVIGRIHLILVGKDFLVFVSWDDAGDELFGYFTIERSSWIEMMDEDSTDRINTYNLLFIDVSHPDLEPV